MPKDDTLKRLGRVLSLIGKLNGGPVKVAAAAEEFGVRKRTIQRDLEMIHRAGFLTENMGDGRHRFADGVSLRGRELTNEQYNALNAMAAFSRNAGGGLSGKFERLFQHITRHAPFDTYIVPVMPRIISDSIPYIKEIEEAIEWGRELRIEYFSESTGQLKEHRICPLKVLVDNGFAYIFSCYSGRPGIFPKYRIDRIKKLQVLDECRFCEPPAAAEALAKARNIWGALPEDERRIKVKLKVDGWARDYFRTHELVGGQAVREQKDGTLLFEAKVGKLQELLPHILRWMPHVTVLAPAALKQEIRTIIDSYTARQK